MKRNNERSLFRRDKETSGLFTAEFSVSFDLKSNPDFSVFSGSSLSWQLSGILTAAQE
jgi:hypothetical protein